MKRPFVFVIMSFAREFGDVYELGMSQPVSWSAPIVRRVDEQSFLESILERIYGQIEKADMVIAEMTGRNPNVFYEVGYAHGLRKPVVLVTRSADDIPFDLRHYPHVVYGGSIATLRNELEKRLPVILADLKKAVASLRRSGNVVGEMDRIAAHIENYMNANKFTMVSFERVRENINASYTNDLLRRLIDERPEKFRRAKLKGNKCGLGRVDG